MFIDLIKYFKELFKQKPKAEKPQLDLTDIKSLLRWGLDNITTLENAHVHYGDKITSTYNNVEYLLEHLHRATIRIRNDRDIIVTNKVNQFTILDFICDDNDIPYDWDEIITRSKKIMSNLLEVLENVSEADYHYYNIGLLTDVNAIIKLSTLGAQHVEE
tara:strand:- start:18100 stop:18579 length:480 start_codon:yes stop_codon:yes gene_type:complete